jgi:molecular chaperone DnaK (HSP70)
MRLGIDFGTTRIVVAAVDRGNYPVVAFDCPDGAAREWVPPLVAAEGEDTRHYGWNAWAAQGEPGVTVVRSIKRVLADCGPATLIHIGDQHVPAFQLLTEIVSSLRSDILHRSSLSLAPNEPLEVLLGVPANANSNQRFLTSEAFRAAGFEVLGLLNEPSAASIEYSHRLSTAEKSTAAPEKILVYDLGGGTFDVSLVQREGASHAVAATESIPSLGGDDFDDVLAQMALETAGLHLHRDQLSHAEEFALVEECRERKEALHPNTRRIVIDLERVREGWGQAAILTSDFYALCEPLVEETLHATEDLLDRTHPGDTISLYVTGGASDLPLVARMLREQFGKRMKRSAYTRSATAIGLAIQADAQSAYRLKERFTRYFGVWREADAGRRMIFDPLFQRGESLPAAGESALSRNRSYSPVHNIGHFRYLECTQIGAGGEPTGDIAAWDEIRFPFDPALTGDDALDGTPVSHSPAAPRQKIVEEYSVDAGGAVRVRIANLSAGYERIYRLARWASAPRSVTPARSPSRRHGARKTAQRKSK